MLLTTIHACETLPSTGAISERLDVVQQRWFVRVLKITKTDHLVLRLQDIVSEKKLRLTGHKLP